MTEYPDNGFIYIATPYTHPDWNVMVKRFERVNAYAAKVMKAGIAVYSPISHNHVIARDHNMPTSWAFWREHDLVMVRRCVALHVIKQDGWQKSIGVCEEVSEARLLGKLVEYVEDNEDF
jgi:hypothetical protein